LSLASQKHYTDHPSGVQSLTVAEHMPYNLGCCVKYLMRMGEKPGEGEAKELTKAALYLDRELHRRGIDMPPYGEFREVPGRQIEETDRG